MVHDTSRGGHDNVAESTRGHEHGDPALNLAEGNVEARRDDTTLVDTAVKLDNDFAVTVVVNLFKLVDVAYASLLSATNACAMCTEKQQTVLLHD